MFIKNKQVPSRREEKDNFSVFGLKICSLAGLDKILHYVYKCATTISTNDSYLKKSRKNYGEFQFSS